MVREDGAGEARYRAFVSYSHRDQAFGRRLHRQLERYAVPRRLVGRVTARGPTPKRVAPVFRDREELSAAHDLTAEIRAALANSGALIVVCSPNAAASPWVAREIELFRELHPGRPVFAALAAGEPGEAFPLPLTRAGGATAEPLAADFRRDGDGPRLGLLKLVAGVLGLGLDELVQRDAQRRLRGVMAVTGAALAGMLAMGLLTTVALTSRAEAERHRAEAERQREIAERQTVEALRQSAEARRQRGVAIARGVEADRQRGEAVRQRAEAEALVEFMLTDLRDKLKGVGRLDVLTTVNERTLEYYAGQDLSRLPPESQARYARILLARGEDDLARGEAEAARRKFRRAEAITARMLSMAPGRPDRLWDQAQTEYWLGYEAYQRAYLRSPSEAHAGQRDHAAVARHWARYAELAGALVRQDPNSAKYRRELAYAAGNLCSLELKRSDHRNDALKHCATSLSEMEAVSRLPDRHPSVEVDLANRRGWLADAYAARGDWAAARRERVQQERAINDLRIVDPHNTELKLAWVGVQRGLAQAEFRLDHAPSAEKRLLAARDVLSSLVASDPQNANWKRRKEVLDREIANIKRGP